MDGCCDFLMVQYYDNRFQMQNVEMYRICPFRTLDIKDWEKGRKVQAQVQVQESSSSSSSRAS
jgi:hypothetical protein